MLGLVDQRESSATTAAATSPNTNAFTAFTAPATGTSSATAAAAVIAA